MPIKGDRQSTSPKWDYYVRLLVWSLVSLAVYWSLGALLAFIEVGTSNAMLLSFLRTLRFMMLAVEILVLLWITFEFLQAKRE